MSWLAQDFLTEGRSTLNLENAPSPRRTEIAGRSSFEPFKVFLSLEFLTLPQSPGFSHLLTPLEPTVSKIK